MIHSLAKTILLSPPKLVRNGGHNFPGVPSEAGEEDERTRLVKEGRKESLSKIRLWKIIPVQ